MARVGLLVQVQVPAPAVGVQVLALAVGAVAAVVGAVPAVHGDVIISFYGLLYKSRQWSKTRAVQEK